MTKNMEPPASTQTSPICKYCANITLFMEEFDSETLIEFKKFACLCYIILLGEKFTKKKIKKKMI